MDNIQKIVYARDAVEGQTYLLYLSWVKVKIVDVNRTHAGIVTSVTVKDERYPNTERIAGDSLLVEYDEIFYLEKAKLRKTNNIQECNSVISNKVQHGKIDKHTKAVNNRVKIKGESKTMAQNKTPRSKVIDEALLNIEPGTVPDWNSIAQKVIEHGRATEAEVSKVIFQAKMRWKWYSKDGKVNPASIKSKSGEKIEETTEETTEEITPSAEGGEQQ